jgi:energy-converting hydrogenase Eha subunit A
MPPERVSPARRRVVVGIALVVASLHLVTGPEYGGPWRGFVTGYLIDIVLPFSLVLLLGTIEARPFRLPAFRATMVFVVAAVSETLQLFGVAIFGRTFDPLDYLAFASGVAGAAVFEAAILSRLPPRSPASSSS